MCSKSHTIRISHGLQQPSAACHGWLISHRSQAVQNIRTWPTAMSADLRRLEAGV